MEGVCIKPVSPTSAEAAELLAALDGYQSALYPPESTHLLPAAELEGPGGVFLGAFVGGRLVGCCGLVNRGEYGELKRLFVRPECRGRRIAEKLLAALEERARADGFRVLRLETGVRQPDSMRVCERAGFTQRGPFGGYPNDPLSVFMEKELAGG